MISYIFFILLLILAICCTVVISASDFRHRIIPDVYLFPLLLIGLILTTFYSFPHSIQTGVIGAIFGYLTALIIGLIFDRVLRRHGNAKKTDSPIGLGDIKLIGVGGLWLGIDGLSIALIIACITGGLWAYYRRQKFIPFAPFFILGGILSLIATIFLI